MASSTHYDVVIIGSGQAGGPLATAFAKKGRHVALVEREHVGGTCINVGCTPTKTLIASGRVAYLAHRGADFGVVTGPIEIDMQKVRDRKRNIVEKFRSGSEKSIETGGVEIVRGEASFTGPRSMSVKLSGGGESAIDSDLIFINTGGRPSRPKLAGLDTVPWLDSSSMLELDTVPDHLLVLGGGYIGLEFGQLYRRLGSRVTVIQRGERLFAREDDDVCQKVAQIMEQDGIELIYQADARSVESVDGEIRMHLDCPLEIEAFRAHDLLVAVGRSPNTEALNLEAAGVQLERSP